ncbi:hypothetical protein M422DRAFT_250920 [Sphaerobolus stellatus SS14]|uniref:Unplaced genomic scaffold SPHSTscaffold_36, whole genome shotgun sequence n=1 Tax=Sphaerobolus stellatus (strain SS14) TaxID=990650 RepID=A0A0C9VF14_SPHS4|nr:hypothetical protein M422DRAFT_250920 [Sphaerobolus stellatus SS14]
MLTAREVHVWVKSRKTVERIRNLGKRWRKVTPRVALSGLALALMPPVPPSATILVTGAPHISIICLSHIAEKADLGLSVPGSFALSSIVITESEPPFGHKKKARSLSVCLPKLTPEILSMSLYRIFKRQAPVPGPCNDCIHQCLLLQEGVFDQCLEDVEGVQHIASPLTGDPDALIGVAVNGTLSLLQSVAAHGHRVKRVVITSSAAALMHKKPIPCVYTEDDWNHNALEPLPKNATPVQKYYSSKSLQEKTAWDFVQGKHFDLVTILPPLVIGPMIHKIEAKEAMSYSLAQFANGIHNEKGPETPFGNWIDVRDVADAHLLALKEAEASGHRLIISAEPASWQTICRSDVFFLWHSNNAFIDDILHREHPDLPDIPIGNPGETEKGMPPWSFDSSRIRKLGFKYRALGESARDTICSLKEGKWL